MNKILKARCLPEEIVFIDDGLNNIRLTRGLGRNGVKFTDKENLVEELKNLQI